MWNSLHVKVSRKTGIVFLAYTCDMTIQMREEDIVQKELQLSIIEGPVRVNKRQDTDQRAHAVKGFTGLAETPTVQLPLFTETLFKAKDFDPL